MYETITTSTAGVVIGGRVYCGHVAIVRAGEASADHRATITGCMRRLRFSRWAVVSAVALATSSVAIAGATSAATRDFHGAGATTTPVPDRPLETAVLDPDSLGGPESDIAYQHLRRTGARFVRIMMNWVSVAPGE